MGYVKTLVLMPYGERLRIFRRHVARLIGSADAIHQFLPLQEHETRRFLKRVLANSSNLSANLRKSVLIVSIYSLLTILPLLELLAQSVCIILSSIFLKPL